MTDNNKQTTGAVMVVGAGIGGIQASLDLANAGFKVYLLDKSPAIGGVMAQLDKTFPTNDCSMCILSPKLVECGRHLNIDILTCSEVDGIAGRPGNFNVRVRRAPRFVKEDECTGCGDCAAACPIPRPDVFNAGLAERRAVYKLYPQAIPNAFAIEKVGTAPCRDACPTHQRAQGYVALIREGRYADAYRTIKEDNPFPSVCGRVCNHKCEDACSRGKLDQPLNIMGLKRFVADWALDHPDEIRAVMEGKWGVRQEASGKKVAVVGSGPAGMTAAQDLCLAGHQVTVFEALPVAGGMMRVGIPEYRLPHALVQREIDDIVSLGVDLRLNQRVDDVEALLGEHDAVLVATGAHEGVKLPIPGNDLDGVLVATEFLRQAATGGDAGLRERLQGQRVLVLGGGNVAIDAALTARRLGAAWVGMSCLESREQMPAHEWEIEDAVEEGVEVFPAHCFDAVTGENGRVTGVKTAEICFYGFDEGRPNYDRVENGECDIPADVVIFAIGQRPDARHLPERLEKVRGRFPVVDAETLSTNIPGIFAGGDIVRGTAFVVDAIAAGHKAARSIDRYLRGDAGMQEPFLHAVVELDAAEAAARVVRGEASIATRHEVPKLPVPERGDGFREVYTVFSEEDARAEAERCLACGICSECNQCVFSCKKECIDHSDVERLVDLNVGAVILTPGLKTIPGDIRPEYGYGRWANVVTSIEFERMLSASGPYGGVVQRPSDGKHPHKVAFIQCVGSRDLSCDQGYCSSVCCMYATKEAVIAREHDASIEPTIFYMDVRSYGKGFEQYIDRAKDEIGIRFVRSMVSAVKGVPSSGNLRLVYASDDGKQAEEEFDLVVLSVGLQPADGTREMAQRLGLALNEYGFAESAAFAPGQTNRPGIFVAGAFAEPKDIPETVIEASAAAAQASALLSDARGTLTVQPSYPPERDVSDEFPRVGVFVCHCGINIGSAVDVPAVVEYARALPDVAYAEQNLYTCSQDTQGKIRDTIIEHNLNRVIVASCTPRTHEPLFQETLRTAGLNPHLFEMTNIREQDSWVHKGNIPVATEKAKDLVRMAVARARQRHALPRSTFAINHEALVVGGGLAGMTAALSLAEQGFGVTLVEREQELGGNLRHIFTGVPAVSDQRLGAGKDEGTSPAAQSPVADPQALLKRTIASVKSNPLIRVLTGAQVDEVAGYVGQYRTMVRFSNGDRQAVEHGVVIVATGAKEVTPRQYGYGQNAHVITQRELEEALATSDQAQGGGLNLPMPGRQSLTPSSVVMIQCVGSRDDERPYCSRICCTEAIKNALALKQRDPALPVYILYRDIRTFGFKERLYREARRQGVVFLEWHADRPPEVLDGSVQVSVQPDGETLTLPADLVVLAAGIEPNDHADLARLLKLPLNAEGFFLEAHVKLRPLDFAADGIFLAGMAHSPRFLEETIAQAQGAAVRAASLLSKSELEAAAISARVNPRLCSACGLCVDICPYGARVLEPEDEYAHVVEVLCQGCGACVVTCPNKASSQNAFEPQPLLEMVEAALGGW